jgi:hypothetical protein
MKLLRSLITIACLFAVPVAEAGENAIAQGAEEAKKAGEPAMPVFDTVERVKAMPPGKATVEHVETFLARLRTADGKQFQIGSERGEQLVWHFIFTALKPGESYELPGAFLAYADGKYYGTAEEIKAMPPCKATVALRAPCYSVFKTADGKWFTIGDPGSEPNVWQFLGTLKDGQSYEFPAAFLDYHKKR